MYLIVWKYLINPENREKFEKEYGPAGSWSKLFSQSKAYIGSVLCRSDTEKGGYLLTDKWKDKHSYDTFLEMNEKIYQQLSIKFEVLYLSENKIGAFNEVHQGVTE